MRSSSYKSSASYRDSRDDREPPVLTSPVLLVLAEMKGLTGAALAAAEPLRQTLDAQLPRIARLDALGLFFERFPEFMLERNSLDILFQEVASVVGGTLAGPRLTELQLHSSARLLNFYDQLRLGDWEDRFFLNREGSESWLGEDLAPAMQPYWRMPLDKVLTDTEEAAALIRLLRLYATLKMELSFFGATGQMMRECSRAVGLWKAVEGRLSRLPSRPGGPAALYMRGPAEMDDPAAALAALVQVSGNLRRSMLSLVAGYTDIFDVATAEKKAVGAFPSPPAFSTPTPRISADAAAVAAVRDAAVAAAAQALNVHGEKLSERYPGQDVDRLRAHTTCRVITDEIPPMTNKEDKLMLATYEVLRSPLPLALLPPAADLEVRIAGLHAEFPWATEAIEAVGGEMLARRRLGALSFSWVPILLVGPPGTGKTRLARRLAEIMGLAFLPLGVGGSSDSRLLTGTSRGWASGEPAPIMRMLRDRRMAQILVLLDEVDKCSSRTVNAVPIHSALLGLLEPESSRNWVDSYLQVPCDLSKLLYVATANGLGGIDAALMSRMQPVMVPVPERHHYPAIVGQVIKDVAAEWGLPAEVLPELELHGIVQAAGSVRELVRLVRREIVREAALAGAVH